MPPSLVVAGRRPCRSDRRRPPPGAGTPAVASPASDRSAHPLQRLRRQRPPRPDPGAGRRGRVQRGGPDRPRLAGRDRPGPTPGRRARHHLGARVRGLLPVGRSRRHARAGVLRRRRRQPARRRAGPAPGGPPPPQPGSGRPAGDARPPHHLRPGGAPWPAARRVSVGPTSPRPWSRWVPPTRSTTPSTGFWPTGDPASCPRPASPAADVARAGPGLGRGGGAGPPLQHGSGGGRPGPAGRGAGRSRVRRASRPSTAGTRPGSAGSWAIWPAASTWWPPAAPTITG